MAILNQDSESDEHDTQLPEARHNIGHEPSALRPPSSTPETPNISQPTEEDSVDAIIDHPAPEDLKLSDPEIDHAVTDIERTDADKVLDADTPLATAVVMKPKLRERIMEALRNIWEDPKKRYGTLGGILLIIIIIAIIPPTRSFALNTLGVRAKVSVTVLDGTNNLPLQGATVMLGGQHMLTNTKGIAQLSHVRLGSEPLQVQKRAFAPYSKQVTVSMGSHKLPSVVVRAIGTQFTFTMTDYVSGKVVGDAEVTSGDASAVTDKTGKAILTVQPTSAATLPISVSASDYRTEKFTINPSITTPTAVALVSSRKDVFISKQSGQYDLYSMDLDGKNKKVLLAATGLETSNISLSVSPDGTYAALVSTRDNQHDADGYLLSALSLINISTGAVQTLEHSDAITLVGWSNNSLAYETTVAGASAANANRERLISYDYSASKRFQLATANYFNGAVAVGNTIYYIVSSTDPNMAPGLDKINFDATSKQVIANQTIYEFFRTDYNTLTLDTPNGWLSYTIGGTGTKASTAPPDYVSRSYTDTQDGKSSLWVDTRDGKGALVSYNIAANKDTTITTQSGLNAVNEIVNGNTIIYHVSTSQESADYAISTQGGQAKKITDSTNTAGLL